MPRYTGSTSLTIPERKLVAEIAVLKLKLAIARAELRAADLRLEKYKAVERDGKNCGKL